VNKQAPDINENGATRLIAALAGEEVRDVLEGKGDVELAKKSLQLLLEIIAGAVPNVPTSDTKESAKPAYNSQRDEIGANRCDTCDYMVNEILPLPCSDCKTIRTLWRAPTSPV